MNIRRQLILDKHLNGVDYNNGHELNEAVIAAMEEYAQEQLKILNTPSVTDSSCAIGRAEEFDICGIWENNGGDCKGCRHYIAHNER